jgi:hypothetical protein
MSTDIWGIDHGYEDALGVWHETPPATRVALLASMGVDPAEQSVPLVAPVQVVQSKYSNLPFSRSLRSYRDLLLILHSIAL